MTPTNHPAPESKQEMPMTPINPRTREQTGGKR